MNEQLEKKPSDITLYRERFNQTMLFIERVFPLGFRKTRTASETHSNRFEAMAIGTWLALAQKPQLAGKTPDVSAWLTSDEFIRLTKSGGSNAIALLSGRINYVRDELLGA
jgi:hypothetical protein